MDLAFIQKKIEAFTMAELGNFHPLIKLFRNTEKNIDIPPEIALIIADQLDPTKPNKRGIKRTWSKEEEHKKIVRSIAHIEAINNCNITKAVKELASLIVEQGGHENLSDRQIWNIYDQHKDYYLKVKKGAVYQSLLESEKLLTEHKND